MKIDLVKLENLSRLALCILFLALFIGGVYGIIKGNYLHFITIGGCSLLIYMLLTNK